MEMQNPPFENYTALETKHTPTPRLSWLPQSRGKLVEIRRIIPGQGGIGEKVASNVGLSDAKDMCRACNAHDDLVAALEKVKNRLYSAGFNHMDQYLTELAYAEVCAALAKAGVK